MGPTQRQTALSVLLLCFPPPNTAAFVRAGSLTADLPTPAGGKRSRRGRVEMKRWVGAATMVKRSSSSRMIRRRRKGAGFCPGEEGETHRWWV